MLTTRNGLLFFTTDLVSYLGRMHALPTVLPSLEDDRAHDIADVAARAGIAEDVLLQDMRTLVTRSLDEPPGFVEGVRLSFDAESVRLDAPGFFRRPMGLTADELSALELGLAVLRQESPAGDFRTIDSARARIGEVAAGVRAAEQQHVSADLARESEAQRMIRRLIQGGITRRHVVEIDYPGAERRAHERRRVRPFGLVHARGRWYVAAWCERSDALRVFRLDRIIDAEETTDSFEAPPEFRLESVMRDGRVLSAGDELPRLRVKYSAKIARWIVEREPGAVRNEDGSVEVEYPLHDEEWAVRHVLSYGEEAEVMHPRDVRDAVITGLAGH